MDEQLNQQALASAANAAYYAAFEQQDLPAMAQVWQPGNQTMCTHPGWPAIHGTDPILQSYAAIFQGPQSLQVILTNELVTVEGSAAFVAVDENLVDGSGATSSASALNVFVLGDGLWKMVAHHASPIMASG